MKLLPGELFLLHQELVVEEALSLIRHDLRNKLGSVRNAAFYIRRKVEKAAPDLGATDPRIPQFFALIPSELESAEAILESRLRPADRAVDVAASAVVQRVRELVTFPANVRVIVEVATEARVRVDRDEAALALLCLIENALDAIDDRDGTIQLRAIEALDHVTIEVVDDGPGFSTGAHERAFERYFTTRSGRMGIGLNIARRLAARWDSSISLTPSAPGVRAALVVRRS